jgi:hypothetical protein
MATNMQLVALVLSIFLFSGSAIRHNKAPTPEVKFDPAAFCKQAAQGDAHLWCGQAEYRTKGEITGETVRLVATSDAEAVATKACLRHIKFSSKSAKQMTDKDNNQKLKGEAASKRAAKEFCGRVE